MRALFYVNEDILNYGKIIIYGMGQAGRAVFFKLLQRNIRVECFADTNPDICGTRFMNIPVIHIDSLPAIYKDAAIIVSGRYAFTIAAELEKRGFGHIFYDYGNEVNIIHIAREE